MRKPNGFTLIELIITFAVMIILSTVGLASFVNYSRTQAMNTAAYDVTTMLNKAKSRAMSQAIQKGTQNICESSSFTGYAVLICGLPGSTCNSNNTSSSYYEFDIVCGGVVKNPSIESQKLPSDITFDRTQTSQTVFLFRSLVGGVNAGGKIVIQGFGGMTKEIEVDGGGNIRLQ